MSIGLAIVLILDGSRSITPGRIQEDVLSLGAFGLLGYLAASAARPLFVVLSGSLFAIAAGLVWGLWGGLIIALLGTLSSAALVFALSRHLGTGAVRELAGGRYVGFERMARTRGFAFVFVATLGFVVPADLVVAVAAVSGMKARKVLLAASLGTLPGTFLMAAIGASVVRPSPLLWWLGGGAVLLLTVVAALLAKAWFPKSLQRVEA